VSTDAPPSTPPGAIPGVVWASDDDRGWPGRVELLDQTRLPHASEVLRLDDVEEIREAIRRLSVRGAPAIGITAAYGLVAGMQGHAGDAAAFDDRLEHVDERLRTSRPTAVNLAWALDRCRTAARGVEDPQRAVDVLLAEAHAIRDEDEAACAAMGRHALPLLRDGGSYLTHCNTGRLVCAGIGTAFGVFVTGHHAGLALTVYACEVRPLLQGSRLTTFELRERGIDGYLLPDSAAGSLLRTGRIEGVFVGADRIAANGDTANKIGTYALAELARASGVPFYVVAPTSTIDASLSDGSLIPIEQRGSEEVLGFRDARAGPDGFPVWNPAFDVTSASLISGIVTERGIARAPFGPALASHLAPRS
jgi:methylthioribose-1-phosphate isomerase